PLDELTVKEGNPKFIQGSNAAVDDQNRFSATSAGRAVLLFGVRSMARGIPAETLRVRVVRTRTWDDAAGLLLNQPATIGTRITSSFDTAGLGTGFVIQPKARFNPLIYDPQQVSGPIIAVNRNPAPRSSEEELVVIWYQRRDKILWPYKPISYQPRWPTAD